MKPEGLDIREAPQTVRAMRFKLASSAHQPNAGEMPHSVLPVPPPQQPLDGFRRRESIHRGLRALFLGLRPTLATDSYDVYPAGPVGAIIERSINRKVVA